MRVNQSISIGSIRINSMSNTSIVQIGASGAIKARSEDITEQVSQTTADKKLEQKITKEVKPLLEAEGIPVGPPGTNGQQMNGANASIYGATNGTAGGVAGGGLGTPLQDMSNGTTYDARNDTNKGRTSHQ
jgi:hypothetical protein